MSNLYHLAVSGSQSSQFNLFVDRFQMAQACFNQQHSKLMMFFMFHVNLSLIIIIIIVIILIIIVITSKKWQEVSAS